MESSTDKIKAIFEIVKSLDDLDKEAWIKLIHTAEIELGKEQAATTTETLKGVDEVLNNILPLVRLARLMIATKDISQLQRLVIVKPLIQEFLWLLSPIEAAGTLQALIYENFEKANPQLVPVMIMPAQGMHQEREDSGRTIV